MPRRRARSGAQRAEASPKASGDRPAPTAAGRCRADTGDDREGDRDRRQTPPAGTRTGPGPGSARAGRPASGPAARRARVPTTAGRASSSTALPASAPGPTPRADSSRTSRAPPVGPVRPGRPDQQQRQQGAAERDGQHRAAQSGADQLGPVDEGGQLAGAAVGAREVDRHRQAGRVRTAATCWRRRRGPGSTVSPAVSTGDTHSKSASLGPTSRLNVPGSVASTQRRRHVVGGRRWPAPGIRTGTRTPAPDRRRSCGSSRPAGPGHR